MVKNQNKLNHLISAGDKPTSSAADKNGISNNKNYKTFKDARGTVNLTYIWELIVDLVVADDQGEEEIVRETINDLRLVISKR